MGDSIRVPSIGEDEATQLRSLFPIFERKIYLNSCSLGPLSTRSRAALEQYADDWMEFGAPAWWLRWIPRIERVRELFCTAIHGPTNNLTIHHSASSALSSIASALDYAKRPKVVISELDFPTISYQWLVKREVEVVFARSSDGVTIPLSEYERLVDERTAAVATSHVFYATGALQDIGAITGIAHRNGALAIVDGYHTLGMMPIDVAEAGVDFYVGGTLKWVCGGPGLTFIYAADSVLSTLPSVTGWFAARDQFAFETLSFEPAESAARFQMGTPSVGTVYTGVPALELLLEVGPERIYERIRMLTDAIVERADALGLQVASPRDGGSRGGVVMLRLDDPPAAVEALDKAGIVADARPGKLRISPHYFNTVADIDAVMSVLGDTVSPAVGAASSS
jgi:kynureninase